MDLIEVSRLKREAQSEINAIIGRLMADTGVSLDVEIRWYETVGLPRRPMVELTAIIR